TTTSASKAKQECRRSRCATPAKTEYSCTRGSFCAVCTIWGGSLDALGLTPFFTALTFGDEVPRSKPCPDIYLEGAKRLKVPPKECLVLEDSHNGIRAAHAAGMIPVMIPDLVPPTDEIRGLCFRILPSLTEIPSLLRTAFSISPFSFEKTHKTAINGA
ncbi:MAG TPA: HAD-IA family hydrolase, partial [Firmicutes bacterium]|nr:HAD-IA family hydrolase [Bacillota bacterium]